MLGVPSARMPVGLTGRTGAHVERKVMGKEPASPVGKERERASVVKGTEGNVICETPCPWAFGKTMLGSVHRREDTILILLQSAL